MSNINISSEFIKGLKQQIVISRYRVAKIANAESLKLYFIIGKMVEEKFAKEKWGAKIYDSISSLLQRDLPGLRGFSGSSIRKMRLFYQIWNKSEIICPSATGKLENSTNLIDSSVTRKLENNSGSISSLLTDKLKSPEIESFISVPFTHHYEIILKIKEEKHRWYYINRTAQQYWTVKQLKVELKNQSHLQEQKLPNNFTKTLSDTLSNKAIRAFKDQYLLDFVNIEDADDEIDERILENEIVNNIKKFLMSLGGDFTFMGNQYRLNVSGDEYFIDLLFFHRGLQSLVAFELKKGKFKPEYVGKMNFYLSALDDLVKQPHENPSIGIILCKEKDDSKVEYSFRDFNKPMGVSVFKTSEELPERFKNALPSPDELKNLMNKN
jgi:predicted nuclease of restriction endonuclease-like (RecB) superfamily